MKNYFDNITFLVILGIAVMLLLVVSMLLAVIFNQKKKNNHRRYHVFIKSLLN